MVRLVSIIRVAGLKSPQSADAADELDLCQKYYPRKTETGVCLNVFKRWACLQGWYSFIRTRYQKFSAMLKMAGGIQDSLSIEF